MPPKRKDNVATRQPRGKGRSQRRTVDDNSSSDSAQDGPRRDPFTRINRDVVVLILHYLSLPDLAAGERVSKGWRATIHWWIAAFGFRTHFPHISWNLQERSVELFKFQARQQHGLQSGKPLSTFNVPSTWNITIAGNFLAYLVSPTQNESFVSWNHRAMSGSTVLRTKAIPLKKVWRVKAGLLDLEMNLDGTLLLRLLESGKPRARSAVYSPVDDKIVWRQDHRHYDLRSGRPGDLTPLLIGRSVLHCARRGSNRDKYDLVGIDFQASELSVVYESSAVRPTDWPHQKNCRQLVFVGGQHELVVLTDNHGRKPTATISILNGENGQLLFQVDGGSWPPHYPRDYCLLPYPNINQISVQSVPDRWRSAVRQPDVGDHIIVQTFSFPFTQSEDNPIEIVRLSTDVVLSPHHCERIAIQPFARVAVVMASPSGDAITTYPLVETKETHLIQRAEAVLKASFPPNSPTPALRHCFVLQEPGTKLGSLSSPPAPYMLSIEGFVDGGRLLVGAPPAQILLEF
ncbi:uncharacterized protein BJX67DRAFT_381140 [Aspergillus lucknowensis]|uniref:F-box domain-containing protein n=1 Tax=Aspergillus lucknowensis TaxID=176173 RepID=A0ABR4LSB3_9EURO